MTGVHRRKMGSSTSAVASEFKFIALRLLEREMQSEDFDL